MEKWIRQWLLLLALLLPASGALAEGARIVALGDSLTAGYGLAPGKGYPEQLSALLKARGLAVEIGNAGVSGDTMSGGLGRLDWSIPEGTQGVIVALGANDALRGIDPKVTRAALGQILDRLKARGIAVLLVGMQAPRNLDAAYRQGFDAMFAAEAQARGLMFYPFLLEGVALDPVLNLADGMHPNEAGGKVIAERLAPVVTEFLSRLGK